MKTDQSLETYLWNISSSLHLAAVEESILPPLGTVRRSKEERIQLLIQTIGSEETQKRVTNQITPEMIPYLTAIAWLEGASLRDLLEVIPHTPWSKAIQILFSLENLLIILYNVENHRFYINPLINTELLQEHIHWHTISPATPQETENLGALQSNFWISLIAGCYNQYISDPLSLRTVGNLKNRLKDLQDLPNEGLSALVTGLLRAEVICQDGFVRPPRLIELGEFPFSSWSKLLQEAVIDEPNLLMEDILFILPPGYSMQKEALCNRLAVYCKRRKITQNATELIDKMVLTGILQEENGSIISPTYYTEREDERPIVTGELTFALSPQLPLKLIAPVLLGIEPTHRDTLSHFIFSKGGYARVLRTNSKPEDCITFLTPIFPTEITDQLQRHCAQWYRELKQFIASPGILLTVAEESTVYMELPTLQPYIIEKITDKHYFMEYETREQWREILAQAGISHVFSPILEERDRRNKAKKLTEEDATPTETPYKEIQERQRDHKLPVHLNVEHLNTSSLSTITAVDSAEDSASKEELFHKHMSAIGEEKNRVSGPDFQQKKHILKDALKDKSTYLHLTISTQEGEEENLFYPIKSAQEEDNTYVQAVRIPDGELVTINLRKVFSMIAIQGYHWLSEFIPSEV